MRHRVLAIVLCIIAAAAVLLGLRYVWPYLPRPNAALISYNATRTPLATFTPRGRTTPTPLPTLAPEAVRAAATVTVAARGQLATVKVPGVINGVPIDKVVVLSDAVRDNMRAIYARGQALGRNPRAFSKIGDSTMVWPAFMAAFDTAQGYVLGPFVDLQATIGHFAGSFGRESAAVQVGMHTWTEFDAGLVKSSACRAGEGPLACELRVHNPSIAIIRLGTNDALDARSYEASMRRIIEYCRDNGVIPVITSKPDRVEGASNTINQITYRLAVEYAIPLWDYDVIAATTEGKGLQADGMHYLPDNPHNYNVAGTYAYAASLQDLTALIMLDTLRTALTP